MKNKKKKARRKKRKRKRKKKENIKASGKLRKENLKEDM